MKTSMSENEYSSILSKLTDPNNHISRIYPGDSELRQPVHTVYGGAHLFKKDMAHKMSSVSLRWFNEYIQSPKELKEIFPLSSWSDENLEKLHLRVKDKLEREALEDFRIDFEDGFGNRPDQEEDETAVTAATQVAEGVHEKTLPPFLGIRIKTFSEELKLRGVRTLDIFLTTLCELTSGKLPENFVVTLPKVTCREHVTALVEVFETLETKLSLPNESLKMEIMVETPQSIFGPSGDIVLQSFIEASKGRCIAAHFGTYDYTASVNVTAEHQRMDHPACDFARSVMKVSLSGTGVWLSDGATNVMPVGPHKGDLTSEQKIENKNIIHNAWRLSFSHVRHSLENGYYQGWDLHPGQLPVRYLAVYSFFMEGQESATKRLKNFIEQAAKATLVGDVFDDAATGQGLLNTFLRAYNCGAITTDEVLKTGLTLEEVRSRSFLKIIQGRRG